MLDLLQGQARAGGVKNFVLRAQLEALLLLFVRMYRPHAAREDTMLFPALRSIMSPVEFLELGKRFAPGEATLSGQDHYDRIMQELGDMEKTLGIHDLEQFTAKF